MQRPNGSILIAFKAINLTPGIRNRDREVATALLDHFNRKTGQCDPSIGRLAALLGMSERTVFRSLNRIEADRLFIRVRHGGHLNRNSYEPNWRRFLEIESNWSMRMKQRRHVAAELSAGQRQNCRVGPDTPVTQTCPINLSKETSQTGSPEKGDDARDRTQSLQQPIRTQPRRAPSYPARALRLNSTSSSDAMREAAHRRWDNELLRRFRMHQTLYGRIIELIDHAMAKAATDAELQRRHGGVTHILQSLTTRDPALTNTIETILREQQ